MSQFLRELRELFARHQQPEPEDHSAALMHFQVLGLQALEALLTTVTELQSAINGLPDKMSQVEVDVGALLAKTGGSASPSASGGGVTIPQDQLDAMGATVGAIGDRMGALVQMVVSGGPSASPTPTPSLFPSPSPLASATTSSAAPLSSGDVAVTSGGLASPTPIVPPAADGAAVTSMTS